jgi:hypothetical protein
MLGTDFFPFIEVTAYSLRVAFKAMLLIIFLSASEHCRCVGLELCMLKQFFNERVWLIQSICGLCSCNQGSPNIML